MAIDYPLAANSIVEARIVGLSSGQFTITTFHYVVDGGAPAAGDGESLRAGLVTRLWENGLRTVTTNSFECVSIDLQKIFTPRLIAIQGAPTNINGSVGEDPLPPSSTVVIKRLTNQAGRKYRGRIFVPDVPVIWHSAGMLLPGGLAAYNAIRDLINSPQTFSGTRVASPIIWSVRDSAIRGLVTQTQADRVLRVQRRREVGRGI